MGLPCPTPPGRLGLLDEFSKCMEEEGLSNSHRDGGPEVILEEDFIMATSSISCISSPKACHKSGFLQPTR